MVDFTSQVAKKFRDGWKHSTKVLPTIKRIFYVAYSGSGLIHLAKFCDYRFVLVFLRIFKSCFQQNFLSNIVGNTQLQFHGTRRACRIAESPSDVTSCNRADCNFCRILKGSYNMERAKGARMFGPGIYCTLVSSKADDYTSNTNDNLRSRVMIVNHVVLGRTKIMYEASHDMQHAPHLYNSVCPSPIQLYTELTFPSIRSLQPLILKEAKLITTKL